MILAYERWKFKDLFILTRQSDPDSRYIFYEHTERLHEYGNHPLGKIMQNVPVVALSTNIRVPMGLLFYGLLKLMPYHSVWRDDLFLDALKEHLIYLTSQGVNLHNTKFNNCQG